MKFPECNSCLNILRFFKFSIRNSLQRTGVGYMGGGDEGKKGEGGSLSLLGLVGTHTGIPASTEQNSILDRRFEHGPFEGLAPDSMWLSLTLS